MVWIFGIAIILFALFVIGSIVRVSSSAVSASNPAGVGTLLSVLVFGGIGFAAMTHLTDSTGWAVFGAIVGGLLALFLQQNSRIT